MQAISLHLEMWRGPRPHECARWHRAEPPLECAASARLAALLSFSQQQRMLLTQRLAAHPHAAARPPAAPPSEAAIDAARRHLAQ